MLNTTSDPLTKNVLLLISKSGKANDLKIVVNDQLEDPGKYTNTTKTIEINPKMAAEGIEGDNEAKKAIHDTIVHELVHYATRDLLLADIKTLTPDQRKWVLSLKNLFNQVQDKFLNDPKHREALQNAIEQSKRDDGFLSKADKSMYYGLTSADEFASMLMTDPEFRDLMNNTTFEGKQSILDRFMDILANIFKALGIQIRDNSVLKEGLTNIVGLVESRNQGREPLEGPQLKSIRTSKEQYIADNFDELLNILNIKSQC